MEKKIHYKQCVYHHQYFRIHVDFITYNSPRQHVNTLKIEKFKLSFTLYNLQNIYGVHTQNNHSLHKTTLWEYIFPIFTKVFH